MRVLQFVCDGAPGGGSTHVVQVMKRLRERGVETALLCQDDSYLKRQISELGFETFGGDFFASRMSTACLADVQQATQAYQPELVHCHGGRANFFRVRARLAEPAIYTVHGFHHTTKRLPLRAAGRFAERLGCRRAQHVVFVCDYDRQLAVREGILRGRAATVIYNGIAPPSTREDFPAPLTSGHVGFVGRFVSQKQPGRVVEAVARLPGVRATMIGDGPLHDETRALAQRLGVADRVDFLGSRPNDEVLAWLGQFDALVMPSQWEGFPILILEAMAVGTPVIATPVGGVVESVIHEHTGLICDDSPAELAQAIDRIQQAPELTQKMIVAARKQVTTRYSEDGMIEQLLGVYREVRGQVVPAGVR